MDAILLAAGTGERSGLPYPKQFMKLGGKTLVYRTLEILLSIDLIGRVIVALPTNDLDLKIPKTKKSVVKIKGGDTRQESVYNALGYIKSDRVLIHEAVRPFINKSLILRLMNIDRSVVTAAIISKPTILYGGEDQSSSPLIYDGGLTDEIIYLNRQGVIEIQLPQIFNTQLLKSAHHLAYRSGHIYNDDTSLIYKESGTEPYIVIGYDYNIKITSWDDVRIAKYIYRGLKNDKFYLT